MQVIRWVEALFSYKTVRKLCCVVLVLSIPACAASTHTAAPIEYNNSVARFITSPFKHPVEKDLRKLIHEVASEDSKCDTASRNEQLVSHLISPNSVSALQNRQNYYWEKALPEELGQKAAVLDSVEQNLAMYLFNLKKSLSSAGLKVSNNNTKIALLSTPSRSANVRSSLHTRPVPVFKNPTSYAARFSPVPIMKKTFKKPPVPVFSGLRAAKGGPYVPLEQEDFTQRYRELSNTLKELVQLENLYTTLPIGKPMAEARITSGFGARRDPFNRRWAQHSGMDFVSKGTLAVYSTGAGKVTHAGRRGAYGNMVIIDHGHGLTSRYAHLSRVSVREGQQITDTSLVGYQGHTGRATGSHLHYEVRMNGKALNPESFVTSKTPPVCRFKTASLR